MKELKYLAYFDNRGKALLMIRPPNECPIKVIGDKETSFANSCSTYEANLIPIASMSPSVLPSFARLIMI